MSVVLGKKVSLLRKPQRSEDFAGQSYANEKGQKGKERASSPQTPTIDRRALPHHPQPPRRKGPIAIKEKVNKRRNQDSQALQKTETAEMEGNAVVADSSRGGKGVAAVPATKGGKDDKCSGEGCATGPV
ncbi:hypothetical protein NL676_008619 [Syzygium grande]|nr:hypothetical protein NL676_008619 [Syzygium grande]